MKGKCTPHIIAVTAFVVFIVLGLACGSSEPAVQPQPLAPEIVYTEITYSELWQEVAKVNSPGKGFIVEAYIINAHFLGEFKLGANPTDEDGHVIYGHEYYRYADGPYKEYRNYLEFEEYGYQTYKRIDENKPYRIYISIHKLRYEWTPIIDRIEGLRSWEEVAAIEAQQKAEREAAEEAANRYDPAKFIIVPSDFKPAEYTKADLFDAVATSERMSSDHQYFGALDLGPPSRNFVSDVVFVSQNGTYITFRTADNAINKTMKVASRTGLTAGQRVRIYYTVYRILSWQVVAIERL